MSLLQVEQWFLAMLNLKTCDKLKQVTLIDEALEELKYVKYHKKKITFLLLGMYCFASQLQEYR